jgi:hypothetical protein
MGALGSLESADELGLSVTDAVSFCNVFVAGVPSWESSTAAAAPMFVEALNTSKDFSEDMSLCSLFFGPLASLGRGVRQAQQRV